MQTHRHTLVFALFLLIAVCSTYASDFTLKIEQPVVPFGNPVLVNFTTTSGPDSYDWIGVFRRDECEESHNCYLDMQTIKTGYSKKQVQFLSRQVPLQLGAYDVRYFKRDSFFSRSVMLARAEFDIVQAPGMF